MNVLKNVLFGLGCYVWLSGAVIMIGTLGWIGAGIATGWIGLPIIVWLAHRSVR